MQTNPPRLFLRFFRWFCHPDLQAYIEGDLMELYKERRSESGKRKADLKFIIDVLLLFRPSIIRPLGSSHRANHMAMFKNYFVISWRNMTRQKMYSAIKIGGLAVGIAACLLIALYVKRELSYDKHYANGARIYRILRVSSFHGNRSAGVHFPSPFASTLEEEFTEFEKVGHYNAVENFGAGSNEVRRAEVTESTHEEGFIYMSQGLLEVLEFQFLRGRPDRALTEPNSIVITKRIAQKYFRNEDPIGKLFILNNDEKRQYTITGIIKDLPSNSHLCQYNFLMTTAGKEMFPGENDNWSASNYISYVRIRPGTDVISLEKKLSLVIKKFFVPASKGNKEELEWLNSIHFKLQPVSEIHFNTENAFDWLNHGDVRYVWLFGIIAAFILVIACINFINLSTAKSANRAKEVGLRKVVGSQRFNLIKQFLTESLLFSLFAFLLGFALAAFLLPYFNDLLAQSLVFPWTEWWVIAVFLFGTFVIGIFAGLYPSFYLSSFAPIQVLKGNISRGAKNSTTRSTLVIFQFTVSIILIIGTIVIQRQMNYILSKKLGFDKEQILILQGTQTLKDDVVPLKNELAKLPAVKHVSISGYFPVEGSKRNGGRIWMEGMQEEDHARSQQWAIDHDYVKTIGLTIIEGRDFDIQVPSDSQAMIISESLVKALQLKKPIGTHLFNWLGEWTVIGVIEDFHFESLKQSIQPMALFIGGNANSMLVKVNTNDNPKMIESITKVWKQFSPHQPIRFTFLDQRYAQMYDDVKRMGTIFTSFAILAIAVACLGLFALSAFMVEQRGKEISIRLVLGASVRNIFKLLTQNFVGLVLISFVIAAPIAWYLMQKWLQDYVYKIEIGWEIFAVAGSIAVIIALFTVTYQSLRAAVTNPVNNLKSE
jgi:putative ABC transport system permease protein